jgi:hypothetical protein
MIGMDVIARAEGEGQLSASNGESNMCLTASVRPRPWSKNR